MRIPPRVVIRGRGRTQPKRDGSMNRTETAYAAHLESLRIGGEIASWAFQPEKLRLADRTFYEPDFRVIALDGFVEFHEVKGARGGKYHVEDDAIAKVKIAAELHPYRFLIVWQAVRGLWMKEEF